MLQLKYSDETNQWMCIFSGYETIVSTGDPATPTQAVMCLAGILMFSFHGSLRILESYNTFQASMSYRQLGSIRHPTSRSLLSSDSSQNRLGYHVHIFNVSMKNDTWKNEKTKHIFMNLNILSLYIEDI